MAKRIIFTTTSDIAYDQRMDRICTSLATNGYEVKIVGRKQPNTIEVKEKPYRIIRFSLFFKKGKLFYLEQNFRLFWYLLFCRTNIISAVDIDTALPAFIISKLRRKPLVLDAHEYFSQQAQVVERPFTHKVWSSLERFIFPKLYYAYTVNNSLAKLFRERFGTSFEVVMNASKHQPQHNDFIGDYIIYVGWVEPGRGLENLIEAAPNIEMPIKICGGGGLLNKLKKRVSELGLDGKVYFTGFKSPEELNELTKNAYLGIQLVENKGESYYYSLANKFFQYIQAEIPQLCVNFPEYKKLNEEYEVALLIDQLGINDIQNAVNRLIKEKELYTRLKNNTKAAKKELCWENEEKKLLAIYSNINL